MISFCVTAKTQNENRYAGFITKCLVKPSGADTEISGNISIATMADLKSAWVVSGNDTVVFWKGVIITVNNKYKVINVDTGNFDTFLHKIRIENYENSFQVGQSLGWLLQGNSLTWYKEIFIDDSIIVNGNFISIYGSGNNDLVGRIESITTAEYDEKIKRIRKVKFRVNMPDIGPDYQQDISEIIDTFSISSSWIENQFNEYLLRYVKQSIIKPKDNIQKEDSINYTPPAILPVKEMMGHFPAIGKPKIKKPCYYLVMYSYISCAPCQALSKKLDEIKQILSDNKIQVVVINTIDSPDQIKKYHERTKRSYFTLYNTEKIKDETHIDGYPTIFLVDAKTEKVIDYMIGMSLDFQLQDWINKAIEQNGK